MTWHVVLKKFAKVPAIKHSFYFAYFNAMIKKNLFLNLSLKNDKQDFYLKTKSVLRCDETNCGSTWRLRIRVSKMTDLLVLWLCDFNWLSWTCWDVLDPTRRSGSLVTDCLLKSQVWNLCICCYWMTYVSRCLLE